VKQNKDECAQLMEKTHQLLEAFIMVHINSETGGEFPPSVLNNIANFTQYIACAQPFFLSLTMVSEHFTKFTLLLKPNKEVAKSRIFSVKVKSVPCSGIVKQDCNKGINPFRQVGSLKKY
jgi:hypothetical protein